MTLAQGRSALLILVVAAGLASAAGARAQVPAEPVLHGRALLGDSVLRSGTVILHRVSESAQGEVDSTRVAADGSFSVRLPAVPDPERSDVYFASVRHAGILYFGKAITLPVQLDSLYEIQAYDTVMAPEGGVDVPVKERSIFLERTEEGRWQVTDLFEVLNDRPGTLVALEGGLTWSHPLPDGATDAEVSQTDLVAGGAEVRDGRLAVTAPIPPGERLFVVRYTVPDAFLTIPLPTRTDALEVFVREPAPVLESPALTPGESAELEPGATFRRLTGAALGGTVVRLTEGRAATQPPARWIAVTLALLLAGVGLWATRSAPAVPAPGAPRPAARDRRALVLEVARLDEAFASRRAAATPEERGAYEARRRELMRRLASLG
ncbi:MAG: hypothetical protein ACYC6F_11945 [Longimicrobiales bacterium]